MALTSKVSSVASWTLKFLLDIGLSVVDAHSFMAHREHDRFDTVLKKWWASKDGIYIL